MLRRSREISLLVLFLEAFDSGGEIIQARGAEDVHLRPQLSSACYLLGTFCTMLLIITSGLALVCISVAVVTTMAQSNLGGVLG